MEKHEKHTNLYRLVRLGRLRRHFPHHHQAAHVGPTYRTRLQVESDQLWTVSPNMFQRLVLQLQKMSTKSRTTVTLTSTTLMKSTLALLFFLYKYVQALISVIFKTTSMEFFPL